MSKYDKYVFRLYTLGKPNTKTKEYFKNRYKGDDAYFMDSPYMSGKYKQYDIGKYKRLGKIQKESEGRPKLREDMLSRNHTPSNGVYSNRGSLLLPHKGISVIGLADPQYSIYDPSNIFDKPFDLSNEGVIYNTKLEHALSDRQNAFSDWYYYLTRYMPDFQDKMNKAIATGFKPEDAAKGVLFSKKDFTGDELYKLYVIGNKLFRHWKAGYGSQIVSDTDYNFGYKPSYYNLIRAIKTTFDNSGANSLVVASIPENALYTSKDVLYDKNAIRGMRDFPEELIVKRLKPIKAFAGFQKKYPDDTFPIQYDSLKFDDRYDIVEDLPADYTGLRIESFLNRHGYKPFEEREKHAKDFINTLFNIDPDYIPSDSTKKYIYKDLSSWYNKNNTDKNVFNGLTQGGRRWQ